MGLGRRDWSLRPVPATSPLVCADLKENQEIHQAKKIWWSPASVRKYARIRPRTSLSLSLIWSPSYAKSNTKTFLGLLRVNLNVIETCKNTLLLQRFFFIISHDLDISFQLKRSGCMKRRQIVVTLFTF